MTGTLAALIVASGLFVSHILLAVPRVRSPIVGRLGEKGFQALYSVLALILLVWMVLAYADAPVVDLWFPPLAMRHLSLVIMPFACVLLVAGMSTANPSAVGGSNSAIAAAGPMGVLKITRHPVMWGFALWGIAHLLANGDAAGSILFGSLTLLAVIGSFAQDAKKRLLIGDTWVSYKRQTSYLPFLALALGRTRMRLGEIGWQRIAGGLALYAALLAAHPWLFGVSPLAP